MTTSFFDPDEKLNRATRCSIIRILELGADVSSISTHLSVFLETPLIDNLTILRSTTLLLSLMDTEFGVMVVNANFDLISRILIGQFADLAHASKSATSFCNLIQTGINLYSKCRANGEAGLHQALFDSTMAISKSNLSCRQLSGILIGSMVSNGCFLDAGEFLTEFLQDDLPIANPSSFLIIAKGLLGSLTTNVFLLTDKETNRKRIITMFDIACRLSEITDSLLCSQFFAKWLTIIKEYILLDPNSISDWDLTVDCNVFVFLFNFISDKWEDSRDSIRAKLKEMLLVTVTLINTNKFTYSLDNYMELINRKDRFSKVTCDF